MSLSNFLRVVFLIPFLSACADKVTQVPPSARDCYRLPDSYIRDCPVVHLEGPNFEDALQWGRAQADEVKSCNERLAEARQELNKLCGTEVRVHEP